MRAHSSLLGLAGLLAACASPQRGAPRAQPAPERLPVSEPLTVSPALAPRVDALARELRGAGIGAPQVLSAGFLATRLGITTTIRVQPRRCVSVLALGTQGLRDLDAHLFTPEGTLLTEDVQPDAHPTVQVCASSQPLLAYHLLEAYEGQGAYAVFAFESEHDALPRVAQAVGGQPGRAGTVDPTAPPVLRRLSELRDGLGRRGFVAAGEVHRFESSAHGSELRQAFAITPERCYTVAVLASGDSVSADVRVLDADDEELARDVRPERDALVQFCPERQGSVSALLRLQGAGEVAVQLLAADAASLGGANTLWLGERSFWGGGTREASARRAAVLEAWRAVGATEPRLLGRGTLLPGGSAEQRFSVDAGRCVAVGAVGGRGVARLELALADSSGRPLAESASASPSPAAVWCATERTELLARARALGTGGEVEWFEAAPPPVPAPLQGAPAPLQARVLGALLVEAAAGYRPSGAPVLAPGARTLSASGGACPRLLAVAEPDAWIVLRGEGPGLEAVERSEGVGSARLSVCGAQGLQWSVRAAGTVALWPLVRP